MVDFKETVVRILGAFLMSQWYNLDDKRYKYLIIAVQRVYVVLCQFAVGTSGAAISFKQNFISREITLNLLWVLP